MKKIIINEFGGPEVLEYIEVDKPSVGDNEVLIQVKNFSVNYADIKNRKGSKAKAIFPMSLGLDLAGTVIEVGKLVNHIRVGDKVAAFAKNGSYSEYAIANDKLVFKLPEKVSFEQGAAGLTVSFLSYILVNKLVDIPSDSFVIVHAASGGVGTTLLQMLKLKGIKNIIAVTTLENKYTFLKDYGAKYTFTYKNFLERVLDVTNNAGVDIVFDSVAGEITRQSLSCLKPYGTLLQFGNSSGEVATFTNSDVHSSCRNIMGYSLGTTRKLKPDYIQNLSNHVFELIQNKNINIHIDRVFDFNSVVDAHKLMESKTHIGKILLEIK